MLSTKESPTLSAWVNADESTATKQTTAESKAAVQAAGLKVKQRKFANGDKYIGGWQNGLPEGEGKYDWSDGSSYEGGWKAGAKHGKGRYIWSSGASYQGEWQHGCMHGVGAFEAPDGSRYQGGWKHDLKHGLGRKTYANGDVYEGLWADGKPDGPGRYIWVDFNEYDGEWRQGRMSGQGTFVWKTGERYDGEWKDGQEDGIGLFSFRDGSTYCGCWRAGKKHGVGIYRPATLSSTFGIQTESKHRKPTLASAGGSRSAFADAAAAAAALPDEAAAEFLDQRRPDSSSQMVLDSPSRSVDGQATSEQQGQQGQPQQPAQHNQQQPLADTVLIKEYKEGKLVRHYPLSTSTLAQIYGVFNGPSAVARVSATGGTAANKSSSSNRYLEVTPLGEVVYRGSSAYDLLQQLQLGIRWSEVSQAPELTSNSSSRSQELVAADFTAAPKQVFLRSGSKITPVHPAEDFIWKDYAPAVFRQLREQADITPSAYISSLCSDQALQLISNPGGRSGALFLVTADERYIIRTVTRSEARVLLRLLPQYVQHMAQQPSSLITRFYGLHRVQPAQHQGSKVRFVVMSNIFCTGLQIHKRFDLKGSTAGRSTPTHLVKANSQILLKDLDLQQCFKLQDGNNSRLSSQITADAAFLCGAGIMDYSLLLGVHYKGQQQQQQQQQQRLQGPLQNFVQHSMEAELSDAVTRLQIHLDHLQVDPRLAAALLELAKARVLVGHVLSAHNTKLAMQQRSPAMLLLTRPLRSSISSKTSKPVPAGQDQQQAGGVLGQHMVAVAAPLGAAAKQVLSAVDTADDLKQQLKLEPVVLYFGIIDLLQCFTFRKKLESAAKRLTAPAASISAVAPRYYALRFKKFMAEVFV